MLLAAQRRDVSLICSEKLVVQIIREGLSGGSAATVIKHCSRKQDAASVHTYAVIHH